MYEYTILEQGKDEDGGTWARYIFGPDNTEVYTEVAPGYDLEERIRLNVDRRERQHKWWNTLTPEEQQRAIKETRERNRRFEERDGWSERARQIAAAERKKELKQQQARTATAGASAGREATTTRRGTTADLHERV